MRQPVWSITVDGVPVPLANKRLTSLEVTDQRGFEADELTLELDATDLTTPPDGAEISVTVGMEDASLGVGTLLGAVDPSAPVDLGTFAVTETEWEGAPDTLRIRARSANVASSLMAQRTTSYDLVLLDSLLATIAARHNLIPVVGAGLTGTLYEHIDQTEESDAHLLTRLAVDHDAVATVKDGRLLFVERGLGLTASGLALPPAHIQREDVGKPRWTRVANPTSYTGVRARWIDREAAKAVPVVVGEPGNLRILKTTHATEASAETAAKAEWKRLQRGGETLSLPLAIGRPAITAETPVILTGDWPTDIVLRSWMVATATHRLGRNGGLTSELELEPAG